MNLYEIFEQAVIAEKKDEDFDWSSQSIEFAKITPKTMEKLRERYTKGSHKTNISKISEIKNIIDEIDEVEITSDDDWYNPEISLTIQTAIGKIEKISPINVEKLLSVRHSLISNLTRLISDIKLISTSFNEYTVKEYGTHYDNCVGLIIYNPNVPESDERGQDIFMDINNALFGEVDYTLDTSLFNETTSNPKSLIIHP